MRFPECSVGSFPDAHFCVHIICIATNNATPVKYRNQKYHLQIFTTPKYFLITYIRNRIRSATVLWILAPYIMPYTIYNPTNNAVSKKYRTQNQNKFNAYIRFRCYYNIQPPMCLHNIEIPPQPNPHFIAKPSANSLDINHPPHGWEEFSMRLFGGRTSLFLSSQRMPSRYDRRTWIYTL